MSFLLAGCAGPRGGAVVITGPSPDINFPHQLASPLPYVSVLPSKRTMEMKGVDFFAILSRIHFDMEYAPFYEKNKNVCLVLIDYRIIPAHKFSQNAKIIYHGDVAFSKKFEDVPQQYALTATFFENCCSPPATPIYEQTIYLATSKAPPEEAMRFLIEEVFRDQRITDLPKLEVNLKH
jgi:hypothetical protein